MNLKKFFYNDDLEIAGLKTDSRLVGPGDLFVCIKGYTVDGHLFAKNAEKAGASAIVCERFIEGITVPQIIVESTHIELPRLAHIFFNEPTHKLNLFGVTGTNGKTTIAYITEHLLSGFGEPAGYIGTNGIRYAGTIIEPVNTTPEALSLQETFFHMAKAGVKNVSFEVSSHALALHRADYCLYKAAVFSNLTPEHLDFHLNMEDYFEAKYQLFTRIIPNGCAVINIDDDYGVRIVQRLRKNGIHTYTYAVENDADFQARDIHMTTAGTQFLLNSPEGSFLVNSPLFGNFNVYNVLGAVGAVYSAGLSMEKIIDLVAILSPIDGRMEIMDEGQDFTVIVDYAHTPDSVKKALEYVTSIKQNLVTIVIGCAGDRDRANRPVIARLSVDNADKVIFTTDDPHSEDPMAILNDMVKGLDNKCYEVITDRVKAIETAITTAQKNDIILITGRGHQKLQYWKNGNVQLDDREVVKNALRGFRKV
ncbi:MAG: UDP-N-acetylmuramoyl-L-alanyl-D-glutamate--2,6-diaminopimelate ligase [Treponema sp.]|nr:UDP-N-acetylmuramoyl-L-alanyl-D-glutamate--2,6-diaminopimelate ligase [Treponema sp.]